MNENDEVTKSVFGLSVYEQIYGCLWWLMVQTFGSLERKKSWFDWACVINVSNWIVREMFIVKLLATEESFKLEICINSKA